MIRTCFVAGVAYQSRPESTALDEDCCTGCAGSNNTRLCHQLDGCFSPKIIWVRAAPETEPPDYTEAAFKMHIGGSFAALIGEAYKVADSGNKRKLAIAFKDLFERFMP